MGPNLLNRRRTEDISLLDTLLQMTAMYAFMPKYEFNSFDADKMSVCHFIALAIMVVAWVMLCVRSASQWWAAYKKVAYPLAYGVAPIFCMATWLSSVCDFYLPIAFVYFVALGIITLHSGISERKLGRANLGLLIILACILQKFFAEDFSLTIKAVIFILAGAAFFTFSFYMNGVMRAKGGLK